MKSEKIAPNPEQLALFDTTTCATCDRPATVTNRIYHIRRNDPRARAHRATDGPFCHPCFEVYRNHAYNRGLSTWVAEPLPGTAQARHAP